MATTNEQGIWEWQEHAFAELDLATARMAARPVCECECECGGSLSYHDTDGVGMEWWQCAVCGTWHSRVDK